MNTFERLLKIFVVAFDENVDTSKITMETALREDLGINSIGLLYMAMAVEEEFGIKFCNEDFGGMTTVADVIACIERKMA